MSNTLTERRISLPPINTIRLQCTEGPGVQVFSPEELVFGVVVARVDPPAAELPRLLWSGGLVCTRVRLTGERPISATDLAISPLLVGDGEPVVRLDLP